MNKHSAKPWEASKIMNVSGLLCCHVSSKGKTIATLTMEDDQFSVEEAEANANLIAAAPELLEALELLYGACNMAPTYLSRCRIRVRTLIAKARGTS